MRIKGGRLHPIVKVELEPKSQREERLEIFLGSSSHLQQETDRLMVRVDIFSLFQETNQVRNGHAMRRIAIGRGDFGYPSGVYTLQEWYCFSNKCFSLLTFSLDMVLSANAESSQFGERN